MKTILWWYINCLCFKIKWKPSGLLQIRNMNSMGNGKNQRAEMLHGSQTNPFSHWGHVTLRVTKWSKYKKVRAGRGNHLEPWGWKYSSSAEGVYLNNWTIFIRQVKSRGKSIRKDMAFLGSESVTLHWRLRTAKPPREELLGKCITCKESGRGATGISLEPRKGKNGVIQEF